ncbi:hypothetical protein GW17_00045477 [Ensete ventricosum]|nr:hypothetical protein GW17_00045477 [Ensete ventricosum]
MVAARGHRRPLLARNTIAYAGAMTATVNTQHHHLRKGGDDGRKNRKARIHQSTAFLCVNIKDLVGDPYVITLLGLFEAKLETFEMSELAMSSDAMLPHLELLPRLHRGADHDAKSLPKYDLKSTAHNRKKEQEEGIHMTPTAMMPSISMLALPEHDNVFIVGVDTSRVGIDITLMQDGPWHERGVSPKELQSMLMPAHAKKK